MNILIVTVRSDFGGGPRHIDQLINNMPQRINLYMAYPKEGEPYGRLWKNNPKIKGVLYIPYRKFSFRKLIEMKKFIHDNHIQIVHSHGNGAGIYSRMLRVIGCKVKIVHTFHGISYEYSSLLKTFFNNIIGRTLNCFCDQYICVSVGEQALGLKKNFCTPRNSIVIYNGIADPGIKPSHKTQIKTAITLSRFDYQKNMDMCLDIARQMKHENIRFIWVGNGNDFKRLSVCAKNENLNIEFTGFQDRAIDFLKESDIYLSTSRFEGLPYALIEAAAVGLPIVATNVVGNTEVAIDRENAILFMTVEKAVNELKALINDDEKIQKLSQASRLVYMKKFTIQKMMNDLLSVYSKLSLDSKSIAH